MKVSVVQRHALINGETAEDINELFQRTVRAKDATGYDHHIVLTYVPEFANYVLAAEKECDLTYHDIKLIHVPWHGSNAGTTFYHALDAGDYGIKFIVNVDDYPIDENGVIAAMRYFTTVKGYPIMFGQRAKVLLSSDERLNKRRQIHECYITSKYKPKIDNFFGVDTSHSPPAYGIYGDMFSGFYVLDYTNPVALEIIRKIKEARQVADFDSSFCPEYLMALLASEVGTTTVCVPHIQNNHGSSRSEETVNEMIVRSSRELLKAYPKLRGHVESPETLEELRRFYPGDEPVYVRDMMLGRV